MIKREDRFIVAMMAAILASGNRSAGQIIHETEHVSDAQALLDEVDKNVADFEPEPESTC